MFLKQWDKYYYFMLWCMLASKILKVIWQGNILNLLVKILSYCYYVLATVYEISFICRTVHLNSMVNCQTPTKLASLIFEIIFEIFFVTDNNFFTYFFFFKMYFSSFMNRANKTRNSKV